MPHTFYLRLAQTPEQRRRVGARGGKATARNRRARLSAAGPPSSETPASQKPHTAAAIAALDAQFPWLRGVEKRVRNQTPFRPLA